MPWVRSVVARSRPCLCVYGFGMELATGKRMAPRHYLKALALFVPIRHTNADTLGVLLTDACDVVYRFIDAPLQAVGGHLDQLRRRIIGGSY